MLKLSLANALNFSILFLKENEVEWSKITTREELQTKGNRI